ncbi:MAG: hypothetical protein WBC00_05640 [Candidatus Omnitrophota bacterium]
MWKYLMSVRERIFQAVKKKVRDEVRVIDKFYKQYHDQTSALDSKR